MLILQRKLPWLEMAKLYLAQPSPRLVRPYLYNKKTPFDLNYLLPYLLKIEATNYGFHGQEFMILFHIKVTCGQFVFSESG